jgi:hypothetical protein
MKMVKGFMLVVFVSATFFGANALATDLGLTNGLSMIVDTASMRSYQLSRSHNAYLGVYGDRVTQDGREGTWLYQSNPDKLLGAVDSQTLGYHVTELGEIGLTLQLYDNDGYPTFYGWNDTETVTNKAGEVVLKDNSMGLEMNGEEPIKFSLPPDTALSGVRIRLFDKNGNLVKDQSLNNSQSQDGGTLVYYPTAFLGDILAQNGYTAEFFITTYNQTSGETTTVVWNPQTGQLKLGYDGSATIGDISIKGVVPLADNSDAFVVVETTDGVAVNPTYKVKLTTSKSFMAYGKTSEGKVANGFTLRWFDETGKILGEEHFANGSTLTLEAGSYHLWFDWDMGDLMDPADYYWYYNYYYNTPTTSSGDRG